MGDQSEDGQSPIRFHRASIAREGGMRGEMTRGDEKRKCPLSGHFAHFPRSLDLAISGS